MKQSIQERLLLDSPDFSPDTSSPGPRADTKSGATVTGVVDRIVYENPETGFFVGRLEEEATGRSLTFVGNLMAISPGETVRLSGEWITDPRFGRQLRVSAYKTVLPSTVDAIEKYLGSGLIEGIGPTFAKRLVNAFGRDTLRIIDEQPGRLREVEGIGKKRASQIRVAWEKQRAIQSIMLFLQGHGIGVAQAVRIYKCYGDAAVAVLRENPYRLSDDITGIAFKSADAIAAKLGIDKASPKRAEAGLRYVLQQATGSGHCFLTATELLDQAAALLEVDKVILEAPLTALVAQEHLVRDGDNIYLHIMHAAEAGTAKLLKRLVATPLGNKVSIKTEKAIQWVERQHGITLAPEQKDAIRVAIDSKVMVVTGGPGTGKTTLIRSLIAIFEKKNVAIALAAPTGRAAKRMESATGRDARTVHRLLEFSPKDGRFIRDENNPLSADLVIIDESSMVDIQLMLALLKAIPIHARLVLVGDVDQLPSVGPGTTLLDIILSGSIPVVWLKTIFRQAEGSGIITNAHRINRGEYPEFNATDFFFVERKDAVRTLETVVDLVVNRIPNKFDLDPIRDIQVLAPMHRGEAGVARLNETLQERLNPHGTPIPRRNLRVGDKVMQLRNNYELDVYNGDVGVVTLADEPTREVQVTFEDRVVLYEFDDLDNLALAYAATVHKSQGSEYPAVVIPLLPEHFMLLQRNLLYTAVTRGKRLVILVGDPKSVARAVRNDAITRRNTRLVDRLRGGGTKPTEN